MKMKAVFQSKIGISCHALVVQGSRNADLN
jgi:hypothetical protein